MKNKDLSVLLGKKWKELNEEEKKPYIEQSLKERENYKKLRDDYKKKNDAPKPPLTPFVVYSRDTASAKPKSLAEAQQAMSEAGKRWKALSDTEKTKYLDRYQKEKEKYEKELAHWTDKRILALPKAAQKIANDKLQGNISVRRSGHSLPKEREVRVIIQNALNQMKRDGKRRTKQQQK